MEFEWDLKKSATNNEKHGLTFQEAAKIWEVPFIELKAKTIDEPRFMVIGKIYGKLYSCIYTMREGKTRLISARRSRKVEEEIYYEHI